MPATAVQVMAERLRRQDRSRPQLVKAGELGGDGNDTGFEQAFSNLAHAFVADKSPSLLDYEQGFQLLDRNQSNTKACGVLGFKVGSQQLYAPVFFLQGDLKGHEMLYIKQSDLFVPMKENWINYLLNKKPNLLGESTPRQTQQIGVLSPDLSRLRMPYKYSSAMQPWARPFAIKYASLMEDGAFDRDLADLEVHCRERLNLGDFIKNASLAALESLVAHCERYPEVGAIIAHFHGLDCIHEGIKSASARERTHSILDAPIPTLRSRPQPITGSIFEKHAGKKTDSDAKQKLEVLTYDTTLVKGLPEGLTEEDQEKLLKEKVLIRDKRTDADVSVPYNVRTEKRLFNPTETGLYWVLVKPGDFEKCLVVIHPHGPRGHEPFCTIARVSDQRNWRNVPSLECWATSRIEGEEFDDWFEGLPNASTLSEGDDCYILLGHRGSGTLPFKVKKSMGEANESPCYEVVFSKFCDPVAVKDPYESDQSVQDKEGQRVHLDAKNGTCLRFNRGDLFIPKEYKKFRLEPMLDDIESKADKEKRKESEPPCCSGGKPKSPPPAPPCSPSTVGSKTPPLWPGDLVDAELAFMHKTAGLKIIHDGTEVFINHNQPVSPLSAFVQLVRDHGFREDVARHMLKRAEAKKTINLRVKYADPYMTNQGPSAPYFPEPTYDSYNPMGANVPTQTQQEQEMPIPELSASQTDRSVYDPRPSATPAHYDQGSIQQATQSGQKEVFDTAMIGSMLKANRDDTMVDKYLPDMVKGMDRKARVLFQLYANGDKFAERYGKQDLPELEDGLRNAFESDGDVIIFLKQKSVEPFPEQADSVPHNLDESS